MIQDKKYSVDIVKFMAALRSYVPRCRECTIKRR